MQHPEVEKRVLNAVFALLTEKGYSGLRIDDVARVSGAAKTTIYRRWSSLPHLVVDTIAASMGNRDFAATDDPVADLRRVCVMLVESINADSLAAALDVHRQPEEELRTRYRQRIIEPPRKLLVDTLLRAKDAGLLRSRVAPTDLADLLIGGAIYRLAILHTPVDAAQIDAVIDEIVVAGPPAATVDGVQ
ncbi:MAG: TetR family transcriptional regulator [Micrococcales bacterium]|nr:MAG: TetR family transcriptional regulator [Micrococcales bacterium]